MYRKKLIGQIVLNIILILLVVVFIYPFLLLLSVSLSQESDIIANGYKLIPEHFSLDAYKYLFNNPGQIIQSYKVTFLFSVITMVFGVLFQAMLAYPLSRRNLKGKNTLSFFVYFTMLFGGGMVAEYIIYTQLYGLSNSIWVYILPSLVNPWNIFMIRTFFQGLPEEMFEAVRIDGGNVYTQFFKFALPLSKPVIAVVAFTTFLGNEYFRTLYLEEMINKNPMENVEMIKKANFLSAQGKENLPECETITILDSDEIKRFKEEVCATYSNGVRKHQQAAAYILMLNTGLRSGEALGLKNSDVDLDNKRLHIQNSVKEVYNRDGVKATGGKTTKVGKTKTKTSKRTVPLNNAAIDAIKELRKEYNYGEESPLICDERGDYTKPVNFRKRFYRILKDAGIETKGLHSLRHTFATNLVNGVKQPDGSIKALNPKQVADLLGHTTSQITEMYYVKKDTSRLNGVTDGFEI